jgi:hypothetical protein
MVRARRGGGKKQPRAALTGGGEDSAGAAIMWPVAACSGIGSWTRRQGSETGLDLAKEREEMGRESKRGAQGNDARFNGDLRRGAEEGRSGPGWNHTVRRWGRGVGRLARQLGSAVRRQQSEASGREWRDVHACARGAVGAGRLWLTGGPRL